MIEQVSETLSNDTIFDLDDDRFFYFVREGFANTTRTEGFSKDLEITSEMLTGECIVDGWHHVPLNLGEPIIVKTASPQLSLTQL